MEYRRLGNTGVHVSSLCLGAMMFGEWGEKDHEQGARVIHRALDAGINFVDTADVYSAGESEVVVGKALAGRRDNVVLATKLFLPLDDDINNRGMSRRYIIRAVENSLKRLDTDWIDLLQLHRFDLETDFDETLSALSDLVHAGKIRYFGHSTVPAATIVEAQWASQRRHHERFVTEQPSYSILTRAVEAEILPTCQHYNMGVLTYSPLGAGWLSGRYRKDTEIQGPVSHARKELVGYRFDLSVPANQRKLDAADELGKLADETGISLVHMAIAFVLRHPAITSAIIGPRTMEHLEGQLGGAEVTLSDDILDRIDELVPPGVSINPADNGWESPALAVDRRRRPAGTGDNKLHKGF